ncbi:MAG: hypothetical protein Fur0028_02400 [Bacteroidales bacterium]
MKTKSILFSILLLIAVLLGYGQTVPYSLENIKIPPTFQQTEGSTMRGTFFRNKFEYLDKSKLPEILIKNDLYMQYQSTNFYTSTESPSKAVDIYKDFYLNLFSPKHISNLGPITLNNTYEQDISKLKPGDVSGVVFYESDGSFQWFYFQNDKSLKKFSISFINNQIFITEELYTTDTNPLETPAEYLDFPILPQSVFLAEESYIKYTCSTQPLEAALISGNIIFQSKLGFVETVEWFKKNCGSQDKLEMFVGKQDIKSGKYTFAITEKGAFIDEWPLLSITEEVSETETSRSTRVLISYPISHLKLYHKVVLNGKTVISN